MGRMNELTSLFPRCRLVFLLLIMATVDLCSAASLHQRPEGEQDMNHRLKGITEFTHFVHCLLCVAGPRVENPCMAWIHIFFWVVGHATVHIRTDLEHVFMNHCVHGIVRAFYTALNIC